MHPSHLTHGELTQELQLKLPFYGSRKLALELRGEGVLINRTSRWPGDSATWSRSSTGSRGACWPGGFQTALTPDSASTLLRRRWKKFGLPVIFNTDQGSQFTPDDFTKPLIDQGVKVSMDGKGRCIDNIFVERLWRSLKYEEVYLEERTSRRRSGRASPRS